MKSGYTVTEMSLSFAILYTRVYHDAVESAAKNREYPPGIPLCRGKHGNIEEMGEVAWRY